MATKTHTRNNNMRKLFKYFKMDYLLHLREIENRIVCYCIHKKEKMFTFVYICIINLWKSFKVSFPEIRLLY